MLRGLLERQDTEGARAMLGEADADLASAIVELRELARGIHPALLISGVRDELVLIGFQRTFAARLRGLGVPVVAIELPWANHAFDEVDGLGAAIAHDATLRFLDATLRG